MYFEHKWSPVPFVFLQMTGFCFRAEQNAIVYVAHIFVR